MAGPQPPAARRGPSSAWSRLKIPTIDPLEVYGLPSKGETKLNDFKTQESYYNKIVERYMTFCGNAGDDLDKQFAALSVSSDCITQSLPREADEKDPEIPTTAPKRASGGLGSSKHATTQQAQRPSATPLPPSTTISAAKQGLAPSPGTPSQELQLIVAAMRKLRESITATHRTDTFAQRSYIFIVRACILTKSWESYHPALLYLLGTIHWHTPLGPSELREFVGYRVLDEGCRIGDLAQAQRVRIAWKKHAFVEDARVEAVLGSLVYDNWVQYWRLRRVVDGYQRSLMDLGVEGLRLHALKCLGRTYFTAEKRFVEGSADMGWLALLRMGVGWELQPDGETVVIRRAKARIPEKA